MSCVILTGGGGVAVVEANGQGMKWIGCVCVRSTLFNWAGPLFSQILCYDPC